MAGVELWEDTPTFADLAQGISEYLQATYHELFAGTRPPIKLDSWNITPYTITCIAVLTTVLTAFRCILDKYVVPPITRHYDIPEPSRKKIPEHAWRFIYFLCIWSYEWYVVGMSGKYKFFQEPESMWNGWSLESLPPGDIYSIHVVHFSFYLHWTYATLFLDIWRKDSVVLVFHHIFALTVMILANITRCQNIGVLMFYLHDAADVFLEFSKLCWYFKIQGLEIKKWIERLAFVALACFTATWCVYRLYWYSLKVVYSGAVHPLRLGLRIPYNFTMNLLMWIQLSLNIYWFTWILRIFYNGTILKNFEDPREDGKTEK